MKKYTSGNWGTSSMREEKHNFSSVDKLINVIPEMQYYISFRLNVYRRYCAALLCLNEQTVQLFAIIHFVTINLFDTKSICWCAFLWVLRYNKYKVIIVITTSLWKMINIVSSSYALFLQWHFQAEKVQYTLVHLKKKSFYKTQKKIACKVSLACCALSLERLPSTLS